MFLNLAYVRSNEQLFIGMIAGVTALGLLPTCALAHPGVLQYDRAIDTIERSRFSIHDLSELGANGRVPRTAHFNMPFELGVAVAVSRHTDHDWMIFGRDRARIERALSDIKTVEVHQHDGSGTSAVAAVSRSLFREKDDELSLQHMHKVYHSVREAWSRVRLRERYGTAFSPPAFAALCKLAHAATLNVRATL